MAEMVERRPGTISFAAWRSGVLSRYPAATITWEEQDGKPSWAVARHDLNSPIFATWGSEGWRKIAGPGDAALSDTPPASGRG
jgi:hypothetical protein